MLSSSWFAQAEDCSGEPSVTHVSNRSGRPPAPPSSAFTYPTAASAASRESGSAAGPLSWEIIAITIGSPFGAGRVVAGAAVEAGGAPLVAAVVAPEVSFEASVQPAASPANRERAGKDGGETCQSDRAHGSPVGSVVL